MHVFGGHGIAFVGGIEAMIDEDVVRQQLLIVWVRVVVVAIAGVAFELEVTAIVIPVLDLLDNSVRGRNDVVRCAVHLIESTDQHEVRAFVLAVAVGQADRSSVAVVREARDLAGLRQRAMIEADRARHHVVGDRR